MVKRSSHTEVFGRRKRSASVVPGVLAIFLIIVFNLVGVTGAAAASSAINGTGSSFAAPAVEEWVTEVGFAPYSLKVNYSSSSSGQGRYEFTNQTTDFAVSDTGYVAGEIGTVPPNFPFIFVPITAAGVAFMYNIPGLTKPLQLTSYTACALFTGGITNWDDPAFHQNGANAGITLPNLNIRPVTESDTTGVNYVMEEWCIDEQPAVWAAFAQSQLSKPGGPTDGVPIAPNAPNSNWPGILPNGLDDSSTTAVAGDVQANSGAIGAVQLQYAVNDGFDGSDPSKNVAYVQNTSGDYTQPTPVDVASALAYATQLANGTHQLDFNGAGPHVYNPSTYSYLLTPTTGWQASKGATMSAFVNYVLTLGQQKAPSFGYASLGLSLEQYGVKAVLADVPGAVAVTSAENAAYACGDLTANEVAAGQTTPTCGVTNASAPLPGPNGGSAGTSPATGGGSSVSGRSASAGSGGSGVSGGGGGGGSGGTGGSGVDPSVSLSGVNPAMAYTGSNPGPTLAAGVVLAGGGWWLRRRLLRRGGRAARARP